MNARNLLLGVLPALAVCLGMGMLAASDSTAPAPLDLTPKADQCRPTPGPLALKVGYPDDGATATLREDGWHLLGRSWLQSEVCGAGTLSITGKGDEYGAELPRLEVSLNGQKLASEGFGKQGRQTQIQIPQEGRLTLAYLNDEYVSEYRLAALESVALRGATCSAPITATPDAAAQWNVDAASGSVLNKPLTLNICGAGTLEMRIWGREADGAFPKVRFEQGGQLIKELTPTLERQLLRLPVQAGTLTVTLTNPYVVQVADRNLYLQKVEFTPER